MKVRGIVFSALFAALFVVFSFINIHLPFTPVPITLENLAVMLAGAILGAGYGFLSMILILVLTALGLPLIHDQGGIGLLVGPTGGYLWLYPICALLTGWFVHRIKGSGTASYISIFVVTYVFGDLLCYVTGVTWLAHVAHLSLQKALVEGAYPYLIGDAVKAVVTTVIVIPVRRVFPVSRITGGHSPVVVAE